MRANLLGGRPGLAVDRCPRYECVDIRPAVREELRHTHASSRKSHARAIQVQLRGTVKTCRDPKDDMFLECAVRAHADLLIAGDNDLLVLGNFEGIRIVAPAAYLYAE